jgi:prepilin-type N-terminal cleavage/methylation domain-containing protein
MRAGFVLMELLLGLVVAAIVASIAAPRFAAIRDAAAVREETLRIVTAIDAARGASVRLNAVATLTLSPAAYAATAVIGPDTVVAWRQPGPSRNAVTLSGTGQPLLFGPAGLAMGVSNRTIVLARGSAVRRVVVSRLGRLTY